MRDPAPKTVYLKDYTPPAFLIPEVELDFEIHDDFTQVRSRLSIRRNPGSPDRHASLALDGDELKLASVALDGRALASSEYRLDTEQLTIASVPNSFTLQTVCRIDPQKNTKLEGLYASKTGLFTQC